MTEKKHEIKRGVSLYSFQEEFYLRKLSLEDLIAISAQLDIPGIEIIGDQMIPKYPNISDEFLRKWHDLMEKHERTPVCLDMYLDWNKYDGRVMTDDEKYASVLLDIKNANKLGCTVIRVIRDVEPKILERLVPEAEKHNTRLALEIHAPTDWDSPEVEKLLELFERVQSPYLGFTLDMSIYCKRLPRVAMDRLRREGMDEEIVSYLIEAYENGTLPRTQKMFMHDSGLADKVKAMGGNDDLARMAYRAAHMIFSDPNYIREYSKHILHIHGKFYEMLPDRAYSVPYEELVPVLIEAGYNGYIDSEYEGNRWIQDITEVDSVEQVRRHQEMLKRLLN